METKKPISLICVECDWRCSITFTMGIKNTFDLSGACPRQFDSFNYNEIKGYLPDEEKDCEKCLHFNTCYMVKKFYKNGDNRGFFRNRDIYKFAIICELFKKKKGE